MKMQSRELARIVIELAWREYDAAREPVLTWLMNLCGQHRDHRVRVRAAQALAVIAAHDYPLIKERVLIKWSSPKSRPVEQLAASWVLEAIVLDDSATDRVLDLLRRWSISPEHDQRRVAVLAYGTAIAGKAPDDAIQGIRVSAVVPGLDSLPRLALFEIYRLGLTREVVRELTFWMRGFPAMREQAGLVLVRISRLHRVIDDEPDGPFDLLWLLAHEPDKVGASVSQLAQLWLAACSYPVSRDAAWQMLGRWAQGCNRHPDLHETFSQLTDDLEKAAEGELRDRVRLHREWWKRKADEETKK